MSSCRNFGNAAERRRSPHPLHAALAEVLVRLKIEFECEAKVNPQSPYDVDFLFRDSGLVVEIDGSMHDSGHDKYRDEQIGKACFKIVRFPTTMGVREIAGLVLLEIAENSTLCHACRKVEKSGKRYCPTCSAEKQEKYRTKRLKLPTRPTLDAQNEPELLQKLRAEAESPAPSYAWKHPAKKPLR